MNKLIYNNQGSSELQIEILKNLIENSEDCTLIDLCCGSAPQTSKIKFKKKVYVDKVDRHIDDGKVIVCDVLEYLEKNQNQVYDVSISTDTIEHFYDAAAVKFLKLTDGIAKKQIWFTPLGDYIVTDKKDDTNPDTHKSGWTPEKLEKLYPGKWAFLEFPKWHPILGIGAFFFWTCNDIEQDFERVKNSLKI